MPIGAELTYVGIASLRGIPATPTTVDGSGNPVYVTSRTNFFLVIEAKKGPSRQNVGTNTFNWDPLDPSAVPDLQIEVNMQLGNGSTAVCDKGPPPEPIGGVPRFPTPNYALTRPVADALNDFSCRFVATSSSLDACTGDGGTSFFFANSTSQAQFCGLVGSSIAFQASRDTVVTVRVLDVIGQPGLPKSFVIRVP